MSAAGDISPRRALVIKLGHIGDVLVSTPVFTALKQAYPGLATTALVEEGTQAMVQGSPHVDQVLVLRRPESAWRAAQSNLGLLASLRRGRFDLAIDLSGGDRGAFLAFMTGARLRVGFEPKKPHIRARAFHRLADPRGTQNHVVETLLRPVRLLGIEPQDLALKLYPSPQARSQAQSILAEHGIAPRAYALVHPTSRWMFKTWTPEGNAQVIRHLLHQGLKVVLSAAPQSRELDFLALTRQALGDHPGVLDLGGRLDLPLLAALIEQARIFFGVDSAPMHMAVALGVPVAVLFGPSGEKMWPWPWMWPRPPWGCWPGACWSAGTRYTSSPRVGRGGRRRA
ncbi:MAG: putative lipopolysaccharide heptosyltransferase III [Desulfarculus sp.]|nr:putative lipopolysaccharide heptosyltransferase III [Desulfarculus sp.]